MDQLFNDDWQTGARFDETRTYRYVLWRRWKLGGQYCSFIMLNPSTADEEKLDPTCAKCAAWARSWRFDGFYVVNAFALRSTDPAALKAAVKAGQDPIGAGNDVAILRVVEDSKLIVVGWGRHARPLNRHQEMRDLLANFHLYASESTEMDRPNTRCMCAKLHCRSPGRTRSGESLPCSAICRSAARESR
jgi:hypothetical protein